MTTYKPYINAVGSYLPKKILTNDDLALKLETSDEWIYSRTGIKQRHIAEGLETTSYMATQAALSALQSNPALKEEIDAIIVATTSPEQVFPSVAAKVQAGLNINPICAFDVQAVCSGFLYAMTIASSMIISGAARNVLVIGAESMSKIVNWEDRGTCVLFGDGAGAVILSRNDVLENSGIIEANVCAQGALADILYTNKDNHVVMNGREVFRHGVEKMTNSLVSLLGKHHLSADNLDWVVPHQANIRMITAIAEKSGVPLEKFVITLDQQANTSAATIPLALDHLYRSGKLKRGDLIAMAAAGGGFTWGALLIRW